MFRYLVLGLLRDGQSRHGYAVMKEYRARSGLQLSTGNFYRELQRLVGEGLVRTVTNPGDADPRRAPYEITDAGCAVFDAWLSGAPGVGVRRYEDELSSRALFLADAEPSVARRLLEGWKEELWIRGKVHERARGAALTQPAGERPRSFAALPSLLARSLKHIAADLDFLEEFSRAYEQWLAETRPQGRKRMAIAPAATRRTKREPGGPDER